MTSPEPVDRISWDAPGTTEDRIKEYVGNIMDLNHETAKALRQRAEDFQLIADAFEQMREWASEASEECQIKVRQLADLSGEVISADYQLVPVEPQEDAEDDFGEGE